MHVDYEEHQSIWVNKSNEHRQKSTLTHDPHAEAVVEPINQKQELNKNKLAPQLNEQKRSKL